MAMSPMSCNMSPTQEPSIDTDRLSYEIFSILESKFLFGYQEPKLWIPKEISPPTPSSNEEAEEDLTTTEEQTVIKNNDRVSSIKNQRGKVCILSIDGGGMRGILPGKALAYLEEALKNKSGDPNACIAHYFDVAAGTGVGGIFAAMLFASKSEGRPISRAEDTWRFLAEKGKTFFLPASTGSSKSGLLRRFSKKSKSSKTGSNRSSTSGLELVMKETFTDNGRSLTLKDTLKPVLIPCYDLSSSAPFLFSRADALETDSFDFRLWEVCRATSAEPALFEPVAMRSIDGQTQCLAVDGGLAMNNPTAAAITHVLHNKQEFPFVRGVEDVIVLSLGSGQFSEGNYKYEQVNGWKAEEWARPMARIAGDGSADLIDHAVAMAFGQSRSNNYVRIQANGLNLCRGIANVDSDPSPSNVQMLEGVAEEMMKQKNVESVLFGGKRIAEQTNYEKLDWFAGEVVLEHQRRSCRIAPTVAFKQVTPKPNLNPLSHSNCKI